MSWRFGGLATVVGAGVVFRVAELHGQLGKQQDIIEPNVAEAALDRLPHMTPAVLAAIRAARPFLSVVPFDAVLTANGLTKTQREAVYRRAFVHVNANAGLDAELLIIPGVDPALLGTIKSGRPWRSLSGLRSALGRTLSAADARRVEQYLFVPLDLNTATDADFATFVDIRVSGPALSRAYVRHRPWSTIDQFDAFIEPLAPQSRPKEVTRLKRYFTVGK